MHASSFSCALIVTVSAPATGSGTCRAAGQIPYGSRGGQVATVTDLDGIDTEHAVVKIRLNGDDVRQHCAKYMNNPSDECVDQTLQQIRLSDSIKGNCRTGEFVNLFGQHFLKSQQQEARERYNISMSCSEEGESAGIVRETLEVKQNTLVRSFVEGRWTIKKDYQKCPSF